MKSPASGSPFGAATASSARRLNAARRSHPSVTADAPERPIIGNLIVGEMPEDSVR